MTVILFLLKLIGIILLVLLGLILTLLVLVLFVPVRYRISGSVLDDKTVRVKLHWLLHLLVFSVSYEKKEFAAEFRILGFRLFPREKKKSALDDTDFDDIIRQPSEASVDHNHEAMLHDIEEAGDESVKESLQEEPQLTAMEYSGVSETDGTEESEVPQKDRFTEKSEESRSNHQKDERQQKRKPERKFNIFVNKCKRFIERVKQIPDKISAVHKIISDEGNHKVVSLVWKQIRYLLRHSRFRKVKTDLTFSAGNPAETGQILGVLCMFPMLYRYEVSLMPDFESEQWYLRGTFEIKGHVRLVHVLYSGIQLWKEKEVRRFINRMMKK